MIPADTRKALAHRWPLRVINGTGTEIQPFSIVRVTGSEIIDGDDVYTVGLPNTTFLSEYLVLGPIALGTGSDDEALATTLAGGGLVQYDTGTTPSIGQEYGPQNATGTIKKFRYGFRIIGSPTTVGSYSVVPARQFDVVAFLCKANADISAAGGTGAVSVYDGNQADTSIDVSGAINRTSIAWTSGYWGLAHIIGGEVFVEPWQCP